MNRRKRKLVQHKNQLCENLIPQIVDISILHLFIHVLLVISQRVYLLSIFFYSYVIHNDNEDKEDNIHRKAKFNIEK